MPMLATISATQPVTAAVLAGLWPASDGCLGAARQPSSSLQQPPPTLPQQAGAPAQQKPQQQPQQQPRLLKQQQQQPPPGDAQPQPHAAQPDQGAVAAAAGGGDAPAGAPCSAGPAASSDSDDSGGGGGGGGAATPRRSTDKPATPVASYSTDSYWNDRYADKATHFDWFYNYSALAPLIRATCDAAAGPCLHIGCGNSGLGEGMGHDGYEVVNVDISPVVIQQMAAMSRAPRQSWAVADCRSMPQFGDASFGSVLDKGTLDAVLCSSHGAADTAAYLTEVHRLLVPGGAFLLVSLGQPAARLPALRAGPLAPAAALPYLAAHLQREAEAAAAAAAATQPWAWERVQVFLLPKPSLYLQSESSLMGRPIVAHAQHSDKDSEIAWLGPFAPGAELDAAIAAQQLDLREFFTAFLCTKAAAPQQEQQEQQEPQPQPAAAHAAAADAGAQRLLQLALDTPAPAGPTDGDA